MSLTPLSSSAGYCTIAQALTHCDYRPIADLCADGEVRLTAAQVSINANFSAALLASSGMVESACLKGGIYTPTDLVALTGSSEALLQWMVAKLAQGMLVERRPDRGYGVPDAYQAIVGIGGWLDRLASGERIFGFQETADAGRLNYEEITDADLQARNDSVSHARRYWGARVRNENE